MDPFKLSRLEINEPLKVILAAEERARLELEADQRGITVSELAHDILALVARDSLVSAVLDL